MLVLIVTTNGPGGLRNRILICHEIMDQETNMCLMLNQLRACRINNSLRHIQFM